MQNTMQPISLHSLSHIALILFLDRVVVCKQRRDDHDAFPLFQDDSGQSIRAKWKLDAAMDLRTVQVLEAHLPNDLHHGFQMFARDFAGNPMNRLFAMAQASGRTLWLNVLLETRDAVRHGEDLSTEPLFLSSHPHPDLSLS